MEIDIRSDLKDVSRGLRLFRKQIPFATALALTQTAKDVQKEEHRQINKRLNKPVRFTQNAVGIMPANKRTLTAVVFIKRIQARYLKYQIEGGQRKGKRPGVGVPTRHQKLNVYGNIPGRKRKAAEWRRGRTTTRKTFIATINGVKGVWERYGIGQRSVRLLVAFEEKVKYNRRLFFYRTAKAIVLRNFKPNFVRAFNRAVATRR